MLPTSLNECGYLFDKLHAGLEVSPCLGYPEGGPNLMRALARGEFRLPEGWPRPGLTDISSM